MTRLTWAVALSVLLAAAGVAPAAPVPAARGTPIPPPAAAPDPLGTCYLGLAVGPPDDEPYATRLYVKWVVPGSPAAAGGIRAGDRVWKVGEAEMGVSDDLAAALAGRRPGTSVAVVFGAGDDDDGLSPLYVTLTAGSRPGWAEGLPLDGVRAVVTPQP